MNFYELLLNRGQPSGEGMTHFERLFAAKLAGGGEIKELEGVPPLLFKANGEPLIDWRIYGNTVQNVTPTPDNPITPQGTGERTGNLFDKDTTPVTLYYQTQREVIASSSGVTSIIMPVNPNTTYTFNNPAGNRNRICETETIPKIDDTVINYIASDNNASITLTTSNNTHYILWWVCYQQTYSNIVDTLSVNLGSTPLPYEPYGYKIPISSANTTTSVYLGEVETTRKIKMLVLTGTNADGEWKKSSTRTGSFYLNIGTNATVALGLCDRAVNVGTIEQYNSIGKMFVESSGSSKLINLWLFDTNISLDDFKAYLAAQYAAGTPVTVWYVLATPETAVVNEPLMKIEEYADSLTATQAGVEIPTIKGNNTLDIDTTVKPSNVYIKYKD